MWGFALISSLQVVSWTMTLVVHLRALSAAFLGSCWVSLGWGPGLREAGWGRPALTVLTRSAPLAA